MVVDYNSDIRIRAYETVVMVSLNMMQRVWAQAIIDSFRTVANAVAEKEASYNYHLIRVHQSTSLHLVITEKSQSS